MPADWDALLEADRRHVWHPYGPMPAAAPPLPVVVGAAACGCGWPTAASSSTAWPRGGAPIHGYRHPVLDAAVRDQLGAMAHVMFGGLTHEPAVRLAERLVAMAPAGLEHVFFADSGSVSVEVAIKMALQYQRAPGRRRAARLLTVRGGYHGDTFGAMGVCDPVGGMHALFARRAARARLRAAAAGRVRRRARPGLGREVRARSPRATPTSSPRVIVEPVVQGAGGMRFHAPACLRAAARALRRARRCCWSSTRSPPASAAPGALFAAEHAGVAPDVMCVGKALTGGYLTLAATLCTAEVARGDRGGRGRARSCTARRSWPTRWPARSRWPPPGCCSTAAGAATWRGIEAGLRAGLEPARELPGVADVRVLGAIGVVQLDRPGRRGGGDRRGGRARRVAAAVPRPVYAMPPYVTGDEDLALVTEAMGAAARVRRRVAVRA